MSNYFTSIVVPCLNEQNNLLMTCQSLGFGNSRQPPPNSTLIIVDNGSEDATVAVAKGIQGASPTGSVIITTEPIRGYVPPRQLGNLLAMNISASFGVSNQHLLIIQADADTIYSDGYVEAMQKIALQEGPGVMIDAICEWQKGFVSSYKEYITLSNDVDNDFESITTNQPLDVIVDDKACAYWASDYELWGGHQREYSSQGDEIHSETTRLYMRARTYNARRYLCEEAIAQHSDRRILTEPAYSFATAGFPRERAFRAKWDRVYDGPEDIHEFCKESNRSKIEMAIRSRRAHLQGLFQILPMHVRHSLDSTISVESQELYFKRDLQRRNVQTVRDRPSVLLEDVFNSIDGFLA